MNNEKYYCGICGKEISSAEDLRNDEMCDECANEE